MRIGLAASSVLAVLLWTTSPAGQGVVLRITWPTAETVASGPTPIEISLEPIVPITAIRVTVDGRAICTLERRPFRCSWNAGTDLNSFHIRAVADLVNGEPLVANVRTKAVRHAERTHVEAVVVPVVVRDGGQFVRGLTKADFEVFEDGVKQTITGLTSEEAPLDLIMAVDVSGSMDSALADVKAAVKQFFTRLRRGDFTTLVGFNDTFFVAAERETDADIRAAAVDLLSAWGGTAMYDATVRALDMVSPENSRKGVVMFSDGADQDSLTTREAAMARVQSSDAMLYTIGFGAGLTVPTLRQSLREYAELTGGRAFFPADARALDTVFGEIVTELANQYVLSYAPANSRQDGKWRDITVRVRKGRFDVRARRGYLPKKPSARGGE